MISCREERPKKQNNDYILFYSNKLTKMQEDIDILTKFHKKVNNILKHTLNDMKKIIQVYQNFCENINIHKKPYENILKKKEEYLDSITNNNNKILKYFSQINIIYHEIQNKMKIISNPEFAPPNINSFSSITQEYYSFDSNNNNNSISQFSKKDEENSAFFNIYGNLIIIIVIIKMNLFLNR